MLFIMFAFELIQKGSKGGEIQKFRSWKKIAYKQFYDSDLKSSILSSVVFWI